MKKVFFLILVITIALTVICGCQSPSVNATIPSTQPSENRDPNVLSTELPSKEVIKTVRDAAWDQGYNADLTNYPKHCNGAWYYGTINDCIVIFSEAQLTAERNLWVADYVFTWRMWFNILVYKDGECCLLEEAYEKGWLTKEHIAQLHERHGEIEAEMDQAYDKWLQSQSESQDS